MIKRIAAAGVLAGTLLSTGVARADPYDDRGPRMERRFDDDDAYQGGRFHELRERMREQRERFEERQQREREWAVQSYGNDPAQMAWLDRRQAMERARFEQRQRREWHWARERMEGERGWHDWRG